MGVSLIVALFALGAFPHGGAAEEVTWFVDVAKGLGIDFDRQKVSGTWRQQNVYEGGVAIADVDGDGWEDVYLTQARRGPGLDGFLTATGNRLFRNLGGAAFEDGTKHANLDTRAMSHGAVFGDYDNDGDPDLFVTNWGPDQLFANDGRGRFTDVTAAAGVDGELCFDPCWSSSAVWADVDNDGWLDLMVMTFRQGMREVELPNGPIPHSDVVKGMRNRLYHNQQDGTFVEVAGPAGVTDPDGEGWMPGFADYDHDGDLDLFLANDVTPNHLLRNDGDLIFTDVTAAAGVPYGFTSMGLAWFDLDNDLDFDIIATEYRGIPTTLLINNDDGTFTDEMGGRGLSTSTDYTGWGVNPIDHDWDGDLDVFIANGDADGLNPFDRYNNFYVNTDGFFDDQTEASGLAGGTYARGSALFDFDRDGDEDIMVASSEGPALLFQRDGGPVLGNGVALRFEGTVSNRDAVGTEFYVSTPELTQLRQVTRGDSFEASSSPWNVVGVGPHDEVVVRVEWPAGGVDTFTLETGMRWWIREGEGVVESRSEPLDRT